MKKMVYIKKSVALAIMLLTLISVTACGEKKDTKKYATDYNLEVKETTTVMDCWDIWKREDDGVIMLQIDCKNSGRKEPRDYLLYWVFDTPEQAKNKYEEFYNRSKAYDKGNKWEEGDKWFVSEEPDVCDAYITWMNYLEGNVIISAELDVSSAWSENDGYDDTTESTTEADTEERFDTSTLKDYVINNAPALKDFVINDILQ